GELIETEIIFTKKSYAEGRLLRILEKSESRVVPPCPVAGVCGGCNWQHLDYSTQLNWKRELVRESLSKFSGFDVSSDEAVQAVVPSPDEFKYRNRVQFHHQNGRFGFFQRGSHRIVDIDDCPITEEAITSLIPDFKTQFGSKPPGRFEAYVSQEGPVRTRGPGLQDGESSEDTNDQEEPGGLSFSFSQVNTKQNVNLLRAVVARFQEQAELTADPRALQLYDLYAGSGNFTFELLQAFPEATVTAVELNAQSVARGNELAQSAYPTRKVRWHQADVLAFLKGNEISPGALVLIDPPRSGCDPEVMQILASSKISYLAYVSCHPVTLARDLKFMKEAGFELVHTQPFDMFPQTDHIETLAVLTRS
ncbi:MAG: class I SAM-dependent RNA methyltransferase, partial [Proteobacteria bacterium]